MTTLGVLLPAELLDQLSAHAEREYPNEACGVVLGHPERPELVRVVPLPNVQDRYHARDPVSFPRTARNAFRIDELALSKLMIAAGAEGLTVRVLYHSHCDAGAYFSPEDRAAAIVEDGELWPGMLHLVVSVRDGRRSDAAMYRWDATLGSFEEARLPLGREVVAPPELALRAMEGKASARPIRPFGGALVARRVTDAERELLSRHADPTKIRVESPVTLQHLSCFARGLYSPLPGFLRAVELRAIEQSGRLLSGTPWRSAVTLDLPAKRSASFPPLGELVELVDGAGVPLAALGLQEVTRPEKDRARLAGPVFVYARGSKGDAAEVRAELLRRGMTRVLAIGARFQARARAADLSGFDGVLAAEPVPGAVATIEVSFPGEDRWLEAVAAQNLGATHVWVEDPAVARAIEETLEVIPHHPE